MQPRIIDLLEPVQYLVASGDAAIEVTGGDRSTGSEEPARSPVPWSVKPGVEGVRTIGRHERCEEVTLVRLHVREVIGGACLEVGVTDRVGKLRSEGTVLV